MQTNRKNQKTQPRHYWMTKSLSYRYSHSLAERRRFELLVRVAPHTHFPGALLQPLGHLSVLRYYSKNTQQYPSVTGNESQPIDLLLIIVPYLMYCAHILRYGNIFLKIV